MYYRVIDNKVYDRAEWKYHEECLYTNICTQKEYDAEENQGKYLLDGTNIIIDPNWEEKQAEKERQRKDNMTLTPADVWRALYKAKQMRSTDLLALIEEQITGIDMNLVEIEFGANLYYRGAKLGSGRLFDVIGNLLGYTSDDMDYLFEHKELPEQVNYNSMTVAQLKALADERGIAYSSNILKADLIALLEA